MDPATLLQRAAAAYGGITALQSVRTLAQLEVLTPCDFPMSRTYRKTFRKAGGFVRIESIEVDGRSHITAVYGGQGRQVSFVDQSAKALDLLPARNHKDWQTEVLCEADLDAVFREVRLTPRNFIAHASEWIDEILPAGSDHSEAAVEVPSLQARFVFERATALCIRVEDLLTGLARRYSGHRMAGEILTAFNLADSHETQRVRESQLLEIHYNAELHDSIFDLH